MEGERGKGGPRPDWRPLEGRRVVSLAVNVPGPVAAARLAALGARVVKVEPPGGDPLARFAPAWYRSLVAGQEVLELDLKESAGRALLEERLDGADLLLTAQRPSALARLGLGRERLEERFPRLRHLALVGHPAPDEEAPGHDLTYLAEAGLLAPPELPRTLAADLLGAERLVSAALALLLAPPGEDPRHAEVALAEAAAALAEPLRHGLTAPGGVLGGGYPFYRLYPARSGWVALAALEPRFAERLRRELGLDRGDAAELEAAFRQRDAAEWEAWARSRDLPLAAVRRVVAAGPPAAGEPPR
ncbi:MAG: CoA transferase [Firmicutes bacterium]|nr:CoA transferase [Bacillota bacterium]